MQNAFENELERMLLYDHRVLERLPLMDKTWPILPMFNPKNRLVLFCMQKIWLICSRNQMPKNN